MAHQSPKSLLDTALDNYDIQATRYFAEQEAVKNSPPDAREDRQKALERAKRHLDSQRMNSEAMASIQAKLDEYRDEGRKLLKEAGVTKSQATKQLLTEKHHPTYKLGLYMVADGKPKPSAEHAAHHIVPGTGKTSQPYLARTHMHVNGIRINDPDNGVWLPHRKKNTPHWSMPDARSHLEYHTKAYEFRVSQRVLNKLSELQIRTELRLIAKLLQLNQFPA